MTHVLSVINTSSSELGIERDAWRFRITRDPRLMLDELPGRSLHSFKHDNQEELKALMRELRDVHHFVVPHNARIETMEGSYFVMFTGR